MKKYSGPSILSGNQNFAIPSHGCYGKFVLDKLLGYKNKVALINGETGDKTTYSEIVQQVVNTSSGLIKLGVGAGDVVAICSENRTEFLTTTIACMCTGAVVTFINCAYSKDEIVHTLKISKPKYIFLSPNTYKTYHKIMQNLNFIAKFFIFEHSASDGNIMSFTDLVSKNVDIRSFEPKVFNDAEKTALILYSSGTTGLPKGAKLSHRNLITAGLQPLPFEQGLVCLSIAPWSNTVGIVLTMHELICNETVVYLNRFNEKSYLKCIENHKVALLLAVPPLITLLSKSELLKHFDVSSVELAHCGGAPLHLSDIKEVKTKFPNLKYVLQGYGMTETTGAVIEDDTRAPKEGSVGRVVDGIIVKVEDVETRTLLGPNQPGEVCVKGPVLFQGYVGINLKENLDSEGYYCTGDIAYYDENGYFYIVDRIKELIKYKAWQVAPNELEAILKQHPGVKDAAVIGAPDPMSGELPTAFVVKQPGSAVTDKELVDFVGPKVSPWKQLRGGVIFIQEIPKNPSGKILRRKLRGTLNKSPASKL